MAHHASSLCACASASSMENAALEICPSCHKKALYASQHPAHRQASRVAQLTPPPSRSGTPRRSLDDHANAHLRGYQRPTSRGRLTLGSASEAFSNALSAHLDDDGDDDDEGSSHGHSLFPSAMYRNPSRSTSRYSIGGGSRRSSNTLISPLPSATPFLTTPISPSNSSTPTSSISSRPSTPDAVHSRHASVGSHPGSTVSGYAPMAAGFARLNRGKGSDSAPDHHHHWMATASSLRPASTQGGARSGSLGPRTRLEASMFQGPA